MRPRLILRAISRNWPNPTLTCVKASFWLLLGAAVLVGAKPAFDGFASVAASLLSDGPIAAEAKGEEPPSSASLRLSSSVPASPFAPEVLSPVLTHAVPDWLTARQASDLRGIETGSDNGEVPPARPGPAIAIVIDDLGADVSDTRRAIGLPAAVTLSFLPYPDTTASLARDGEAHGHQVLVHVPMEPKGRDNPGPNALLPELSRAETLRRVAWDLDRVPGFSGINNHMGSRFTADRAALIPVIETLADRHVFFLDSRTTPQSVVVPLARSFGVASAARDVFLDDEETANAVDAQLALTEHIARRDGIAIAIGHPHAVTLAALGTWTAHLKGIALVPVSVAIRRKTEDQALVLHGN